MISVITWFNMATGATHQARRRPDDAAAWTLEHCNTDTLLLQRATLDEVYAAPPLSSASIITWLQDRKRFFHQASRALGSPDRWSLVRVLYGQQRDPDFVPTEPVLNYATLDEVYAALGPLEPEPAPAQRRRAPSARRRG